MASIIVIIEIIPDPVKGEYESKRETVDFSIYLAFIIALLSWALWLQSRINELSRATKKIGEGDFSSKISLNKFSSLGSLNHSVNEMARQIESWLLFQKNMVSTVSHELRTPLTRMKFELEYIESNSVLSTSIGSINEDVDELNEFIAELLEYAKTESNKLPLRLENSSIPDFLHRWQSGFKIINDDLLISVQVITSPINGYFDEKSLTKVMNNLVNNALRYAKSQIVVQCEKVEGEILIYVDDDGLGIPKE